jgi:hypothetical protein
MIKKPRLLSADIPESQAKASLINQSKRIGRYKEPKLGRELRPKRKPLWVT